MRVRERVRARVFVYVKPQERLSLCVYYEGSFVGPDATVSQGALSMNVYVHLILTYFGGFVNRLPQARGV